MEDRDSAQLRKELDEANAEIAKLKAEKATLEKKLTKEKNALTWSNKGLDLHSAAQTNLANALVAKCKSTRVEAVEDFLKSDAYYFLSRLDAGETRTEAFFDWAAPKSLAS